MERVIAVRGKLADARHIELDEPITEIEGPVEVFIRPAPPDQQAIGESIFDVIARLPGGNRSKEDIDRQIREERESWDDR
jgi:hypothetical protein